MTPEKGYPHCHTIAPGEPPMSFLILSWIKALGVLTAPEQKY
jgi:hypothetical protein